MQQPDDFSTDSNFSIEKSTSREISIYRDNNFSTNYLYQISPHLLEMAKNYPLEEQYVDFLQLLEESVDYFYTSKGKSPRPEDITSGMLIARYRHAYTKYDEAVSTFNRMSSNGLCSSIETDVMVNLIRRRCRDTYRRILLESFRKEGYQYSTSRRDSVIKEFVDNYKQVPPANYITKLNSNISVYSFGQYFSSLEYLCNSAQIAKGDLVRAFKTYISDRAYIAYGKDRVLINLFIEKEISLVCEL